jgi:hypothetical protein
MSKSTKSPAAKTKVAASAAVPMPGAVAGELPDRSQGRTTTSNAVGRKEAGRPKQPGSKQSRVIAMLQSPAGATIAAMMKATGWQQHSVRGFLAGVVRKRLKLKLGSKKVDGARIYQIAGTGMTKLGPRKSKRLPS